MIMFLSYAYRIIQLIDFVFSLPLPYRYFSRDYQRIPVPSRYKLAANDAYFPYLFCSVDSAQQHNSQQQLSVFYRRVCIWDYKWSPI